MQSQDHALHYSASRSKNQQKTTIKITLQTIPDSTPIVHAELLSFT